MRDALVEIYLHCIWGTWDRLPLICSDNQKEVYSSIIEQCEKFNCSVIALGGMPDHIHLLIRFPATITVADLIKSVKGSTSHLITHQVNSQEFFKWQGSYAAFSVSKKKILGLKSYIVHQEDHHSNNTLIPELEL